MWECLDINAQKSSEITRASQCIGCRKHLKISCMLHSSQCVLVAMAILPVLQHMLLNIGTGHYIHAHVCIHNLSPKLSQKRKTLANSTMLSLHTKGHRILHSRQGPLDRHSPPVPRNSPKKSSRYYQVLPQPSKPNLCRPWRDILYNPHCWGKTRQKLTGSRSPGPGS